MIKKLKKRGFTLIELLVVTSIILVLTGASVGQYNEYNRRQELKETATNVVIHLREAQNNAYTGVKTCNQPPAYNYLCCSLSDRLQYWLFDFIDQYTYKQKGICGSGKNFNEKTYNTVKPVFITFTASIQFSPLSGAIGSGAQTLIIHHPGLSTNNTYNIDVTSSGQITLGEPYTAVIASPPPAPTSTVVPTGAPVPTATATPLVTSTPTRTPTPIFTATPTRTPTPTTPAGYPPPCDSYGDIDSNNIITDNDANMVSAYAAGTITLTTEQLRRADVDASGTVNSTDGLRILSYAGSGNSSVFPVCP